MRATSPSTDRFSPPRNPTGRLLRAAVTLAGLVAANWALAQTAPRLDLRPAPVDKPAYNFTCDSQKGTCTCTGDTDCFRLGQARLCDSPPMKDDFGNQVCRFRFRDTAPIAELQS